MNGEVLAGVDITIVPIEAGIAADRSGCVQEKRASLYGRRDTYARSMRRLIAVNYLRKSSALDARQCRAFARVKSGQLPHSRSSTRSGSRKHCARQRYRIDFAILHPIRCLRHCSHITEPDRHQPFAGDLEIKDIEPVVIADNVVELLRLDTLRDIDVLVQEAFGLAQGFAEHFA